MYILLSIYLTIWIYMYIVLGVINEIRVNPIVFTLKGALCA